MKTVGIVLLVILAVISLKAYAGDLYICKQPNGVKAYQDHPCSHGDAAVGKSQIRTAPYTPPPTKATASDDEQHQRVQQIDPPARDDASSSQPAPTVAYQCTAGRRTWMQSTPCPTSYAQSVPMHVSGTVPAGQYVEGISDQGQYVQGYTVAPQHVEGTGYAQQQAPVREQTLDSDAACQKLSDHSIKLKHSGSSDTYERNLARAKYCGH